jgi:hypothetical protein
MKKIIIIKGKTLSCKLLSELCEDFSVWKFIEKSIFKIQLVKFVIEFWEIKKIFPRTNLKVEMNVLSYLYLAKP